MRFWLCRRHARGAQRDITNRPHKSKIRTRIMNSGTLLTAGAIVAARHACARGRGFPVERVSCRTDGCTGHDHNPIGWPFYPGPVNRFPARSCRSGAFCPPGACKPRRRNRTGVRHAAFRAPGIRSPDPHESLFLVPERPLGPIAGYGRDALVPVARVRAAGMLFVPNPSRPGRAQRTCRPDQPACSTLVSQPSYSPPSARTSRLISSVWCVMSASTIVPSCANRTADLPSSVGATDSTR